MLGMSRAGLAERWTLFVGAIDNVLKPLLLGRGISVPMLVIFVGAIGGFIGQGIIGLFLGAVVLALGYELLLAWLGEVTSPTAEPGTPPPAAASPPAPGKTEN